MLLSMVLAWLSVLFIALSAAKYIVRKKGSKKLKQAFSRTHIAVGTMLILTGLVHGILSGNASATAISDLMIASVLFTWNWGTACLVGAVLLALSYLFRKQFKKVWMPAHRVLTVALLLLIVVHVANVGIQVDDRIAALFISSGETESVVVDVTPNATETDEPVAQATPPPTNTPRQSDSSGVIEEANALFSGAQLADGTYEGSADGYNGAITVSVTVSAGQVTSIEVVSERDTEQYFSRALALLDTIINGQSLEVDAVSGATFSSAGIINAVSDALQNAVVSGELTSTQFSLPSGGHNRP